MSLGSLLASFSVRVGFAFAASCLISFKGHRKRSLNVSGAIFAVFVGFVLTLASYCFFTCLLTFFVSSSFWTRWRSEKKKKVEDEFKEGKSLVTMVC